MAEERENAGEAEEERGMLGALYDFNQMTMGSISDIWDQSIEQVKATPGFVRSLFSEVETRSIAKNIGVIAATDLAPIIAVNAAMVSFDSYVRSQSAEASYALELGWYLAKGITYLVTARQTAQALTRIGIVQAKQSSIYDEATKGSRRKVSNQICCDCTQSRFLKGNLRAPLVYAAQQGVIFTLRRLIGGIAQIQNFDLIVDSYASLVIGQLIMDYRLANDGLCERHQHEYNQQFWERVIALGLPVVIIRKILAGFIESYTGVDKNLYGSMIETFVSVAMVGLAHHITFPNLVEKSNRYMNPVSGVRSTTAYVMDKVAPDTVAFANKMLAQEGEPMDYRSAYKTFMAFYKDPKTQTVLMFIVPYMYLDPHNFVNDPVVRDYWPTLQNFCLEQLDEVEKLQKLASTKPSDIAPKFIVALFDPFKKTLNPIYKASKEIFEESVVNPGLAWMYNSTSGNVKKLFDLLRDSELKTLVSELQDGFKYLTVDANRSGFLVGCIDSLNPVPVINFVLPQQKFDLGNIDVNEQCFAGPLIRESAALSNPEPMEKINIDNVISAVIKGINNYTNFINNNITASFNSPGAAFGTVSTLFIGGTNRDQGKIRAAYYLKLLQAAQPIEYKLVACIAMLSNDCSSDLRFKICKSINNALNQRYQAGEGQYKSQIWIDSIIKIFNEVAYEKLLNNEFDISKGDFIRRIYFPIQALIDKSNYYMEPSSVSQKVDDWYGQLDKTIKKMQGNDEILMAQRIIQ